MAKLKYIIEFIVTVDDSASGPVITASSITHRAISSTRAGAFYFEKNICLQLIAFAVIESNVMGENHDIPGNFTHFSLGSGVLFSSFIKIR